jgi:hypothetical protein
MALANPQSTDFLNSPSHSKGHRVYDWDTSAPDDSVTTDASGNVVVTTGTFATTMDSTTLAAAATTLAITSNVVTVTGDAGGNTLATITGGASGQLLALIFANALVTITDNNTGAANTVNLYSPFTSTTNGVLLLVFNGTSWREVARSVTPGSNIETPSGTVDGSNVTFTVSNAPIYVIIDGNVRVSGFGYTYSSGTITVDALNPPVGYIRSVY